jgi:hypothetical protein
MKKLFLSDLVEHTEKEVLAHIKSEWEAKEEQLKDIEILVAYESVGDYGCDSSAFYLFRNKKTKQLYEVHGSHCSCYGFESQWEPEEATLEYLQSDNFGFSTGGYDRADNENTKAIKAYIAKLRKPKTTI